MAGPNGYRAFAAEVRGDPIGFYLHSEKFEIPRPLPFMAVTDLLVAPEPIDAEGHVRAEDTLTLRLWRFLRDVLPEEDVARLEACMRKNKTTAGVVDEIVSYVVEEAGANPTGRRPASAASPSTSGTTSSTAVRRPASTRRGSRSAGRSG